MTRVLRGFPPLWCRRLNHGRGNICNAAQVKDQIAGALQEGWRVAVFPEANPAADTTPREVLGSAHRSIAAALDLPVCCTRADPLQRPSGQRVSRSSRCTMKACRSRDLVS